MGDFKDLSKSGLLIWARDCENGTISVLSMDITAAKMFSDHFKLYRRNYKPTNIIYPPENKQTELLRICQF